MRNKSLITPEYRKKMKELREAVAGKYEIVAQMVGEDCDKSKVSRVLNCKKMDEKVVKAAALLRDQLRSNIQSLSQI